MAIQSCDSRKGEALGALAKLLAGQIECRANDLVKKYRFAAINCEIFKQHHATGQPHEEINVVVARTAGVFSEPAAGFDMGKPLASQGKFQQGCMEVGQAAVCQADV